MNLPSAGEPRDTSLILSKVAIVCNYLVPKTAIKLGESKLPSLLLD